MEMKNVTVTIRNNEDGEVQEFDTNAIVGSFVGDTREDGGTDTGSFLIGRLSPKELLKLTAANLALVYKATGDKTEATIIIKMAHELAREANKHGLGKERNRP